MDETTFKQSPYYKACEQFKDVLHVFCQNKADAERVMIWLRVNMLYFETAFTDNRKDYNMTEKIRANISEVILSTS